MEKLNLTPATWFETSHLEAGEQDPSTTNPSLPATDSIPKPAITTQKPEQQKKPESKELDDEIKMLKKLANEKRRTRSPVNQQALEYQLMLKKLNNLSATTMPI